MISVFYLNLRRRRKREEAMKKKAMKRARAASLGNAFAEIESLLGSEDHWSFKDIMSPIVWKKHRKLYACLFFKKFFIVCPLGQEVPPCEEDEITPEKIEESKEMLKTIRSRPWPMSRKLKMYISWTSVWILISLEIKFDKNNN